MITRIIVFFFTLYQDNQPLKMSSQVSGWHLLYFENEFALAMIIDYRGLLI